MYIKTINTNSKYKCIVMRGNDPSRVDRGEGYRAVVDSNQNICTNFITQFTKGLLSNPRKLLHKTC